jgi:hypothetical protein
MTTNIKSTTTRDGYYVCLEIDKSGLIIVSACPRIKSDYATVGYPVARCTYGLYDMKNAKATYRRYVKKYGGQ